MTPRAWTRAMLAFGLLTAPRAHADLRGRASVQPAAVRLGEPVRYSGAVTYARGELVRPRWVPPDTAGSLTWGSIDAHLGRGTGSGGAVDTLRIETTLQAFQLGVLQIPGVVFVDEGVSPPAVRHLPGTTLRVVPVLAAADTDADLRGLRGPLAAPWWERVPWGWIIAGLVALVAIIGLTRMLRRRAPAVAPVPVRASDPATLALARLAELRGRGLPGRGAFGAHALELTSILRRFLEATDTASRPGQTTTELATWLRSTTLSASEVEQLTRLMRGWDALKFARGESNPEQARQSEAAVETFVRGHAAPSERAA